MPAFRGYNIILGIVGKKWSGEEMYHFIVNPNARTGKGEKIWHMVETQLDARGVDYSAYFTEHPRHGTELARKLTYDDIPRNLVVIGGDGSMNEVVNGIVNTKNLTLGYIPAGSSNDLARSLRIPSDPLEALEHVLAPKTFMEMDIGVTRCGDVDRRFAVSSGVGYDAAVCHVAINSGFKKKLNKLRMGKLTYFGIALQQLFVRKPFGATLILDGTKEYKFDKVVFMAAHNQRFEGGGFMFCPEAVSDDGLLDVIVADSLPPLRIASLLPGALKGKHIGKKGIYTFKASQVEIKCDSPQPVHLDGEIGGVLPEVKISCLKDKVRIITS